MGNGGLYMGLFGRERTPGEPHPRQVPRVPLPLSAESIETAFRDCVDLYHRTLFLGGDPEKQVELYALIGMVRMERVSDYVLRPLTQDRRLAELEPEAAFAQIVGGAFYNLGVNERTDMDQVVEDLVIGNCVLVFPGLGKVLAFVTGTEEKRSIGQPENEPAAKGAMDSFVENLWTNTSMVRRHLRTHEVKHAQQVVGRRSLTPVSILWVEGLTDPGLVEQVKKRIGEMDIDALLSAGNLEEYLVDETNTPFPMLAVTQRPDRFCGGLMEGRVGILAEGLAVGYLAPGTVGHFFATSQDRSINWMAASCLSVLRYLCVLLTLFLPGLYVAAVIFHPEMIPVKLAVSINAAKAGVPFPTVLEVLIMLLAFEMLQEAGLRLPGPIGQTISILGGLVVGTAAVEAKIVSPAVLITVATAGIAGYTVPNQDFSAALRLWRFGITVAASIAGSAGLVLGGMALVCHLAGLESFGVAYLTPFAANAGEQVEGHAVLRQPLPRVKLRPAALDPQNRRNQK